MTFNLAEFSSCFITFKGVSIIVSADISASDMRIIVISVIGIILHWEAIFVHVHCAGTLFNVDHHVVIRK